MLLLLQFAIATATDKLGKKNPLLNAKLLITYPQFPWLCIVFFVLFFFNPSNFNPGCLCSTCLHKHMSAIWILQIKFTQWITQDYCWCGFFCSFVCFFFFAGRERCCNFGRKHKAQWQHFIYAQWGFHWKVASIENTRCCLYIFK